MLLDAAAAPMSVMRRMNAVRLFVHGKQIQSIYTFVRSTCNFRRNAGEAEKSASIALRRKVEMKTKDYPGFPRLLAYD